MTARQLFIRCTRDAPTCWSCRTSNLLTHPHVVGWEIGLPLGLSSWYLRIQQCSNTCASIGYSLFHNTSLYTTFCIFVAFASSSLIPNHFDVWHKGRPWHHNIKLAMCERRPEIQPNKFHWFRLVYFLLWHLESHTVLVKVRCCRVAYPLAYCWLHNKTTTDVAEVPSLKVLCQTWESRLWRA